MESHPAQPGAVDPARTAALCARAGSGGPDAQDAVEELLYLHHGRFLGFARRKLGIDFAGKLDPEDILQESYAEVFRDIGRFEARGDDAFYAWVTRIIEHRFIDQARALRRKKRDMGREASPAGAHQSKYLSLAEQLSAGGTRPSGVVARHEAVGAMMACLARLPADERLVLERVHLAGEHPADVGREIGRSEDAVRRLGGRACERLRGLLGRASRYLSAG